MPRVPVGSWQPYWLGCVGPNTDTFCCADLLQRSYVDCLAVIRLQRNLDLPDFFSLLDSFTYDAATAKSSWFVPSILSSILRGPASDFAYSIASMASATDISLFNAPLEIRWKIYEELFGRATHLFLHDGKLHVMPCQGTDDVSHRVPRDDANMSDTDDSIWTDPIWIRRVESSWGCHWQCEETYLDGVQRPQQAAHMSLLPVLLSSKTM